MEKIDIHEAKRHVSRLVDQAARGKAFVIGKAGKPLVKVVPLDAPEPRERRRLGFLAGEINTPDDFDRMGQDEIERGFGADA